MYIMKTTLKSMILATVAAALATPAFAKEHEQEQTDFYVQPFVGSFTINDYCDRFSRCDDTKISLGLNGGYQFNEFVALEAGFLFASGFDVSIYGGRTTVTSDVSIFSLGGRGKYPISDIFFLTAKMGMHSWEIDADANIGSSSFGLGEDGLDPYLGAGVGISHRQLSFLAEGTFYIIDEGDVDADARLISISAIYEF